MDFHYSDNSCRSALKKGFRKCPQWAGSRPLNGYYDFFSKLRKVEIEINTNVKILLKSKFKLKLIQFNYKAKRGEEKCQKVQ